jgi:hypothetical protein
LAGLNSITRSVRASARADISSLSSTARKKLIVSSKSAEYAMGTTGNAPSCCGSGVTSIHSGFWDKDWPGSTVAAKFASSLLAGMLWVAAISDFLDFRATA